MSDVSPCNSLFPCEHSLPYVNFDILVIVAYGNGVCRSLVIEKPAPCGFGFPVGAVTVKVEDYAVMGFKFPCNYSVCRLLQIFLAFEFVGEFLERVCDNRIQAYIRIGNVSL